MTNDEIAYNKVKFLQKRRFEGELPPAVYTEYLETFKAHSEPYDYVNSIWKVLQRS